MILIKYLTLLFFLKFLALCNLSYNFIIIPKHNLNLTCSKFKLNGSFFSATCTKRNNSLKNTSIDLNNCIFDYDGMMMEGGNNYRLNCAECYLKKSVLTCKCLRRSGRIIDSSIDLAKFVSNFDGALQC